ncbi:hypothetical protein HMPREF1619_00105 [Klebsiella pneumoniae 909957]|nr:hypothetical protein HMPREF1619_00105 [Klebsiella pneumoniae 909957]
MTGVSEESQRTCNLKNKVYDADGLWLKYTFIAVAIPALKG